MLDEQYTALDTAHSDWHRDHSKNLSFTTAEKMAQQERTIVGRVTKRPKDDGTSRLIKSSAFDVSIPQFNGEDELRIRLAGSTFGDNADPHIPGYLLSSRNGNEYGFVRANVDPYAKAMIPLTTAQRQLLAEQYTQLGLGRLGNTIRNSQELTVDDLVTVIRSNTQRKLLSRTRADSLNFRRW